MARRKPPEFFFNFESLTDIITNIIGIMLIFALIAVMLILGKTYRVKTPFIRMAEKTPIFFECRNDRIIPVRYKVDLEDPNYYYVFMPYRTILIPRETDSGESIQEIKQPDSAFNTAVMNIDSRKEFGFFFVRPDSFEIFRSAREIFWKQGLEVGWRPRVFEDPIEFSPYGEPLDYDSGA
ncbi:hypothetical protein ACFL4G_02955 [Thermodesulfobacteriota bacterium]